LVNSRSACRLVDLSVPMGNFGFEPRSPKITRYGHREYVRALSQNLGLKPEDFPDSMSNAMDFVEASTHSGTHVDAPLHYGPMSEGRPSKSIDEVPLEWCYGPGVVLDLTHKQAGDWIRVPDLELAVEGTGRALEPGDIALIHTGCDAVLDSVEYLNAHPGLDAESVFWLLDRGVRVIGIDAYGLDRPFKNMAEETRAGIKGSLFPAHVAGRSREYLQIEKLCNLSALPQPTGFDVACFPIKIEGATGGWTRAVAFVPEELYGS